VKFKVHRKVSSEKLAHIIPRQVASQLTRSWFEGVETLVLSFSIDRNHVVLSALARRAVASLCDSSEPRRLAIGGCFTLEALEVLKAAGFTTIAVDGFAWTDESYKRITKAIL